MTPHDIERVGRILWGDSWRKEILKELDIGLTTLKRWLAQGEVPGPVAAWARAQLRLERRLRKDKMRARRLRQRRGAEGDPD